MNKGQPADRAFVRKTSGAPAEHDAPANRHRVVLASIGVDFRRAEVNLDVGGKTLWLDLYCISCGRR